MQSTFFMLFFTVCFSTELLLFFSMYYFCCETIEKYFNFATTYICLIINKSIDISQTNAILMFVLNAIVNLKYFSFVLNVIMYKNEVVFSNAYWFLWNWSFSLIFFIFYQQNNFKILCLVDQQELSEKCQNLSLKYVNVTTLRIRNWSTTYT